MIFASNLKIAYEKKIVVDKFTLDISKGEIISLIGPNGSGKSSILKVMSRLMKSLEGAVHIDGKDIHKLSSKDVAKHLSVLSQYHSTPPDFTVEEIVRYGRMPHQKWYETSTKKDEEVVNWALKQTRIYDLRERSVNSLSGGERQRAWIAMALAQKPKVLLLDEPTTFLDICHQIEIMELINRLNKELNLTVVMVLHDLNHAIRYSSRIVVIKDGKFVAQGSPEKVLTKQLLRDVYNVEAEISIDQRTGKPVIMPVGLCHESGLEQ